MKVVDDDVTHINTTSKVNSTPLKKNRHKKTVIFIYAIVFVLLVDCLFFYYNKREICTSITRVINSPTTKVDLFCCCFHPNPTSKSMSICIVLFVHILKQGTNNK